MVALSEEHHFRIYYNSLVITPIYYCVDLFTTKINGTSGAHLHIEVPPLPL